MARPLAVRFRIPATRTVHQYGPVVLSLGAAGALSLLLREYTYPRPLFLLALVLSIWGRGLGPGLVGAGLATVIVHLLFPELLPAYGLVSDTTVFGLAAVAISAFSSSKLRAETRREGVEDQLRTSERRLALAQSAAHLGVWERDLRTDTIAISGEYASLYSLPPDRSQLTHQEWIRLIHPDDRERVEALVRDNTERPRGWDAEFRVVWPDGSVRWLLGKGTVLFDDSGQPVRRVGVNLDITELKQAEDVRSHLAAIVESSDDAIISKTLDGKIVSWNPGAERLYGYKAEEIVGRPMSVLVPPELADELPHVLERLRQGGSLEHYESTHVRNDGRRIDVSTTISPIRDSTGAVVGASAISRDVTKQRRVEAALRESEERFRNMADTAPVMIWVSGPDKDCTFVNKVWLGFTGRTMEQELGSGWAEGVHPDDVDRAIGTYFTSFDARRSFQIEYRVRRADGNYRWVLDNGVPRFAPGDAFAGYIGTCVDITDVRTAQEEALARQKLESLGMLANGIAHDFNNLLGGILASAELGLTEHAEGASPEEELQRIRTAAIRGGEIVGQLMAYGGQESAAFQLIDVSLLAEEMLQLLKISIAKRVVLDTHLGKNLPVVHGSPGQIRQVVMNLVTNASEAIGERDGVIRVSTARVTIGPDTRVPGAGTLPAGDYLKVEVSDTGSGMTPEVRARLFEPFFTTKFPGRGLGLATVQGIVRGHNGIINVASSVGHGTTFEVLLPCTSQAARNFIDTAAPVSAGEAGIITGTVLVVEDEDMLRLPVSKVLRTKGLSVIEAIDGGGAVDLFRANVQDIAVVLLDMTLPKMSGSEVFAELRRIRPDVKVILTSAYSQETVLKALGGQHAWDFIQKPYQLNDLVSIVSGACLPKRGMRHHLASGFPPS